MPNLVFSQSNSAGSGYATNTKYVRISYSEVYDLAANRSTVTLTNVELMTPSTLGNVPFFGKILFNGSVVADFEGYSSTVTASADTYCPVNTSISYGSVAVAHDAQTGAASMSVELRGADSGYQNWFAALYSGGKLFGIRTAVSQTVSLTTHPRASTILACPASIDTQDELGLTVSRNSPAFYHKASFSCGQQALYTSGAFETELRFTIPRSWFSQESTLSALAVTVSVQTYTDALCTVAVGSAASCSLTVRADAGMRPVLSNGWVSISPYNSGAVANISGYVKGYSRAQAVFDDAKISLANTAGATIASRTLSCQGVTVSTAPYRTGVLAAREIELVCTVTDSRGRKASESFSLAVMDYEMPSLSGVEVFRCTSAGIAADEGIYYSVKATLNCSSLDGQNSPVLSAAHAAAGGSYGTERSLVSGAASVIGTVSADTSYTVRLTGRDLLDNEVVYYAAIPTRKWAMKFRPNGSGAAFGKAAERDNCLELASGWELRLGGESIFSKIYPVGSLYLSVNSADPATLFGGTWERITDRFLLCAGERFAALSSGGAATHLHGTADGAGNGTLRALITTTSSGLQIHRQPTVAAYNANNALAGSNTVGNSGITLGAVVSGQTAEGTNLPPYLAVYVWKRTA